MDKEIYLNAIKIFIMSLIVCLAITLPIFLGDWRWLLITLPSMYTVIYIVIVNEGLI